jgi:hypothetical protein
MATIIYIVLAITITALLIGALVGVIELLKVHDQMGVRDFKIVPWVSKKTIKKIK